MISEAAIFADGLIVCSTPLLVVVYLLRCLRDSDVVDGATLDLLVDEITSDQPRLLRSQRPAELPVPSADIGGR